MYLNSRVSMAIIYYKTFKHVIRTRYRMDVKSLDLLHGLFFENRVLLHIDPYMYLGLFLSFSKIKL